LPLPLLCHLKLNFSIYLIKLPQSLLSHSCWWRNVALLLLLTSSKWGQGSGQISFGFGVSYLGVSNKMFKTVLGIFLTLIFVLLSS
ncbi:MAG: hypothetical protein ACRDL7_04475, partial [Gaiellaceae bacterium]